MSNNTLPLKTPKSLSIFVLISLLLNDSAVSAIVVKIIENSQNSNISQLVNIETPYMILPKIIDNREMLLILAYSLLSIQYL